MVTKDADENFSIDDLLNLSNDEAVDVPFIIDGGSANGEKVDIVTANDGELDGGFDRAKEKLKGKVECAEERSYCPHADASLYAELCVPPEQLAELEWVSNFLDETLSPEDNKKLQLIRGTHTQSVSISVSNSFSGSGFDSGSGSGFDSGSISSSPENPLLQYRRRIATRGRRPALNSRSAVPMIADSEYSESRRKQPKPVRRNSFSSEGMKCTHCGTEKTPQWRTGPKGPKSLCNACGVRYKSGRLVPEYRPAASPTFEESKHSNSHRKVMELRTKKTMMMMQDRLMDSDSA